MLIKNFSVLFYGFLTNFIQFCLSKLAITLLDLIGTTARKEPQTRKAVVVPGIAV